MMDRLTRVATAIAVTAGILYCTAPRAIADRGATEPQLNSDIPPAAGEWERRLSGTSRNLLDVYGGASSAFAAGDFGTLLFFDGDTWRQLPTPSTFDLNAVWGFAFDDGYAVGDAGRILRIDGDRVDIVLSSTSSNLFGVWGRSSGEVYAVGDNGAIVTFDGGAWRRLASGTALRLNDVAGNDDGVVVAVGANGTAVRRDGDAFVPMQTPTTRVLHAVWTSADGEVIAVGDAGTVLRLASDGGEWTLESTPTMRNLRGVWGLTPNKVFAAGDGGVMLYNNGRDWLLMNAGTYANLARMDNGFVVGDGGVVLQNAAFFDEVSNLRITEVVPAQSAVEVTNDGPALTTAAHPFSHRDDNLSAIPFGTRFDGGEIHVFDVDGLGSGLSRTDTDLWLYRTAPLSDAENVVHGVKYGSKPDVGRMETASSAGKWPGVDAYAPAPPLGTSLAFDGFGFDPLDWYVDETPTLGSPDATPPGVVSRGLVFPSGAQDFEDVSLGDEVFAIDGWTVGRTGSAQGVFTAHVVNNVNGDDDAHGASTRWLRIRDQQSADTAGRVLSPVIESFEELFYTWSFDLNHEQAGALGPRYPRLMMLHDSVDGFVATWGVELRNDYVSFVVTGAGGDETTVDLYRAADRVGEWVSFDVDVDLPIGEIRVRVDGVAAAVVSIEPAQDIDGATYRMAYIGDGEGNAGTVLLDDIVIQSVIVDPFYFADFSAATNGDAARLTWAFHAEEPITGFDVYRQVGSTPEELIATLPPDAIGYDDAAVSEGTYRYAIVATTPAGDAIRSRSAAVTFAAPAPVGFTGVSAAAWGSFARVSWRASGDVAGFRVYKQPLDGGVETRAAELPPTASAFEDRAVQVGHSYRYTIAAIDRGGNEVRSESQTVTITPRAVSLSAASPNPFTASTRVTFTLNAPGNVVLRVYDVRGRLVDTLTEGAWPAGVHNVDWNGRNRSGQQVSVGTYFFSLQTHDGILTRKAVLVR